MDKFMELVDRMRSSQCAYFRTRSHEHLESAKRLEKLVDEWIDREKTQQRSLWNMGDERKDLA